MRKLSLFLTFALVIAFCASVSAQGINDVYISDIDGTYPNHDLTGQLYGGATHTIEITFDATGGVGYTWLGTNAFEMYSPDGADWGYLSAVRGPYILALPLKYTPPDCAALESYLKHSDKVGNSGSFVTTATAGMIEQCFTTLMIEDPYTTLPAGGNVNGNDTVGFYHGAVGTGVGYFGGTSGVAILAEFTSYKADDGLHICFDTTAQIQAWEWAAPGYPLNSGSDFPEYDNGLGASEAICWEVYDVPNEPPDWDPDTEVYDFNHCEEGTFNFGFATDPEEDYPLEYSLVAPNDFGAIDLLSGVWTWSGGTVPQADVVEVHVRATDSQGQPTQPGASGIYGVDFVLHVTTTNQAPYFTSSCPVPSKTVSVGSTQAQNFGFADDDVCDVPTVSINHSLTVNGDAGDVVNIVGNQLFFTPFNTGVVRTVSHFLEVTDGDQTVACEVVWNVIIGAPYQVMIEKIKDQIQGQFTDVAVDLMKYDANDGFGGFDLLIAYDNSALAFQLAYEGDIYTDCGWEYFTYRFGPYGNCGSACPSGMLKIVGMAETNNGPNHPGCDDPAPGYVDAVPKSLAYLRFLVSNDRTLECQYVPIRFYWYDCTNNILSNHDGSKAMLSQKVFDFGSYDPLDWFAVNEITGDGTQAFPTYQGARDDCIYVNENLGKIAERLVDFQNGGVDIVCADSIDARGDINLNGLAYEIADAVMFTNFFIEGLGAFGTHIDGSIAASDTNADGIALSVADLVYLVRVVVGDAQPYAKTSPVAANVTYGYSTFNVDTEMGAAHIVMAGNVVPELLANNMEMKYGFDGQNTNILVYSTEANQAFAGDFLRVDGGIVSTEFATFAGATVVAKVMPSNFVLHQNYPNPFNPSTKFTFEVPGAGAWKLDIYNITGQLVESFSGSNDTGFGEVEWDASDRSSGIYFYRLSAGDNTMTKKAVLLK
jgi:hypothetical protein